MNNDAKFIADKNAQYKACMEIINGCINDPFSEKVYGMFLGAFVGDATGAYLEFYGGTDDSDIVMASEKVLDYTMTMPGGGYHGTAPG